MPTRSCLMTQSVQLMTSRGSLHRYERDYDLTEILMPGLKIPARHS